MVYTRKNMADEDYKMNEYALNWAYNKLFKAMGLLSFGAVLIGTAIVKELKVGSLFIVVGTVLGSYGIIEGWNGIKVLKQL